MKCKLQDLINLEHFQNLQDRLNEIYSFPSAIIDNAGNILTSTAWQELCTQFHRKNKNSERLCIQSDQYILSHLHDAKPAVSYHCPHGLVDNAAPIIIDGVHYGNFFTGQFFLKKPDLNFFRAQARKYGFDENAYLSAVKKVPIWTQKQLDNYLLFIKELINIISESGLKKLKEIEIRKQIEENEERANTIIRQMHDGFWIVNTKNGRIIDVNDAMCRMSGYTRDEMLKMSVSDVEAEDSQNVIRDKIKHIIKNDSANYESRFRHKNGSIFVVEVSDTYLPKRKMLFSFHRDITERKRIEDALRESEEKYRSLVETAYIFVWISDIQGRFTYLNPTWEKMFGYKKEEMLGKMFGEFQSPEVFSRDKKEFARFIAGGSIKNYESTYIAKDGRELILLFNVAPLRNSRGAIIGTQGTALDITYRKRTEEALAASVEFTNSLITSMQDGFAVLDADGVHLDVNPALCNMTGFSREELVGASMPHPYWPLEEREHIQAAFQKTLKNKACNFELIFMRKNGERFPVIISVSPVKNIKNGIASYVAAVKDITERKIAEEKIRNSLREKELLLMEVNHRVKNNLQIINSLYSLQAEKIGNEKAKIILKESHARVKAIALVHEKLYQSRDFSRIDMEDYIKNLVKSISKFLYAEDRQIRIDINVDSNINIGIDSTVHCGLIINELVTNSLKHAFAEGKGGVVSIELRKNSECGYELIVSDNGIGLPADFDISKSQSLGLEMVQALAKQLGSVTFDGRNGTTVKVLIKNIKNVNQPN